MKQSMKIKALAVLLCLGLLCGCQSLASSKAEKLINRIDVDAPEAELIAEAREACEKLSEEELSNLDNYDRLLEAETVLQASEIDALIGAIGEITLSSREAIEAARAAYDGADEEVRAAVASADVLDSAEEALAALEASSAAAGFDAAVAALGEITAESGDAVRALRETYESLSEEAQAEVTSLEALEAAEAALEAVTNRARAAELDNAIAALGEVSAENVEAVQDLLTQYGELSEEARELVTGAETLEKAGRAAYGILDAAAAAEVKRLNEAKQYDEAIEYAEKRINGRRPDEVQGGLVRQCVNAYASKANSLTKSGSYEEAYELINACRETYAGADLSAATAAMRTLNQAIGEPRNGQLFASSARGGYCTLTIRAGDTPAFVKLINDKDPKLTLAVYVAANRSATVHVRNGPYTIRYARGEKWFGTKLLFGKNTRYFSTDTTLSVSTDHDALAVVYHEYKLTLGSNNKWNISFSPIDASEF